jgi:hypothetical protein
MDEWTWKFGQATVDMWYSHRDSKRGQDYLAYTLTDEGKIIFEGYDFSPSPLFAWDSEDSVMALLHVLTLQPGDTDEEYFAEYTQEQLDWIEGETAEELRMLWLDYEYAKEE